MTNDTTKLLEHAVFSLEKALLKEDLEYQRLKESAEECHEELLRTHRGNHSLLREINNALDAKALLAEYHAEFRLLLGLQMGLELREIRLLPQKERLWRPFLEK